ncbi:MAG: crossover junction endodeoxyribonuclease RuvC [Firmicutes bacterium]|jgi:crossover junction endodeoxyribonuclease RuvC|nr:crossover junction endodeoxyribonuclease RuvC [Bacillota bacterium]
MTRILGIDPGVGRIGFGVIDKDSDFLLVDYGTITTPKVERQERLSRIHSEVSNLLHIHKPDLMALEKLFFNKNLKTAMAVGEAIGVVLLAAYQASVPVAEYTPLQVKEVLAGSGRAKKHEIKGMLELFFNQEIKGHDDAADALAVAYCHLTFESLGL